MKANNINGIKRKLKKRLVTVKDLEKIVEHLIFEQQIQYTIKGLVSITMEYITLLELMQENGQYEVFRQDKELEDSILFVIQTVHALAQHLTAGCQDKEKIIKKLEKIRSLLTKRVRVLTAYQDELEVYQLIAAKARRNDDMRGDGGSSIDDRTFAAETLQFIFSQKDNLIINEKLKAVLKYLPVRITKQKFYDYVTKSIGRYYGGYTTDLNAFIHMSMDTFYPKRVEGYGEFFPFVAASLKKMENWDLKNITREEVVHLKQDIDRTMTDINYGLNLCHFAMGVSNKLMAMIGLTKITVKDVAVKETALESVFEILELTKRVVEKENTGAVISGMVKEHLMALEGIQEKWMEQIKSYAQAIHFALDGYPEAICDLGFDKEFEEMKKIELLHSDNLFAEVGQQTSGETQEERVDNAIANRKAQELVGFLETYMSAMSREIRRAKMGQLMALIPPAFDKPEEVYEYILNAMEMCSDNDEKLAAANAVSEVVAAYRY